MVPGRVLFFCTRDRNALDFYPFSDYNAPASSAERGSCAMMTDGELAARLAAFNQLYKEMDQVYHQYARDRNISDTALWLLYSLCEEEGPYTQRELCTAWHWPPQTVNSALKSLEKQGILRLDPQPGSRKNKIVRLTSTGQQLVRETIVPVFLAEKRALESLEPEEQEQLLVLTRRYTSSLQRELGQSETGPSPEGPSAAL